VIVRPQPGPQEAFLSSLADIVIYGGAARGGKTYGLLMEPLRHIRNPGFSAILFRRTYPQIMMDGGSWQEAGGIYPALGAKPLLTPKPRFTFPSGAEVSFAHLQHDKTVFEYQGSKLPLILFDELTHFTESQFWYLRSRNTGTCGVTPYMRATCNPVSPDDPVGGWVNHFVEWWIDRESGFPIVSRSGVLRWFYRVAEELRWYDSAAEARADNPNQAADAPTSVTFIPAKLEDNPIQMAADPGYRGKLMSLPLVERERLLGGNWKIRHEAGTLFKREWFTRFVDHVPWGDVTAAVRYWDNAASDKADSDSTAGVGIARTKDGRLYVFGVEKGRYTTHARRQAQAATAGSDRGLLRHVELWIEQEGGSGGKDSTVDTLRELAPYAPRFEKPQTNKVARAGLLSAQAEQGNVYLVRGSWNHAFVEELCNFPSKGWHDDQVDAASGAASRLLGRVSRPSGSSGQRAS